MAASTLLSDADLHGLIDGHIAPDRRADVLRRAAASPRDRALVEAWQDQADLIRTAFAGIEREPLPAALDLRTPPQLHAVPPVAGSRADASPAVATSRHRWRPSFATAATLAAVAFGLAGSWYVAGLPTGGLRLPAASWWGEERVLSEQTFAALASGEVNPPPAAAFAGSPTTTTIPDLSSVGFTFTGEEARGTSPQSLIFRYRNARDEQLAVGAARTEGDDSAPTPRDAGFTWRSGRVAYAIYGTVPATRLAAIASSLHGNMRRD